MKARAAAENQKVKEPVTMEGFESFLKGEITKAKGISEGRVLIPASELPRGTLSYCLSGFTSVGKAENQAAVMAICRKFGNPSIRGTLAGTPAIVVEFHQ